LFLPHLPLLFPSITRTASSFLSPPEHFLHATKKFPHKTFPFVISIRGRYFPRCALSSVSKPRSHSSLWSEFVCLRSLPIQDGIPFFIISTSLFSFFACLFYPLPLHAVRANYLNILVLSIRRLPAPPYYYPPPAKADPFFSSEPPSWSTALFPSMPSCRPPCSHSGAPFDSRPESASVPLTSLMDGPFLRLPIPRRCILALSHDLRLFIRPWFPGCSPLAFPPTGFSEKASFLYAVGTLPPDPSPSSSGSLQ